MNYDQERLTSDDVLLFVVKGMEHEYIASRRKVNNYSRADPGFLERGFIFICVKGVH